MVDICIFFPWAFFSAPFCVVWHSSREVMGEACHIHESGYCNMSVCAPLPAQRTDRSAKDWTLSNSSERHAQAHCDHTPPTQHRGRMQPPPPPLHTHINIYTHTHLVMPPSTWTCHSTFDNRRLHVGYIIITARTCKANRSCSAPHQKPTNQQQQQKKKQYQQSRKVTKRHLQ